MKRLRVGVLGCASIARRSVIPAMRAVEGLELVAIASRSKEKAESFASDFDVEPVVGYQALLDRDDIHAVYIPLPTGLSAEWIPKALERGKHVLAEKSLACDYESAAAMVATARRRALLLMENFMFRYHPQHRVALDLLEGGQLGTLRLFRSSFGFPPLPAGNFRYDPALGGGALLDAAGYTIKAAQLFLGASLRVTAAVLHYDREQGVDIHGSASLVSDAGVAAQVAFGFDNFYQCNYEIWGSTGKLVAERAFTPPSSMKPRLRLETQGKIEDIDAPADDHFAGALREFHRAIVEKDIEDHLGEALTQSRLLSDIRSLAEELRA
jgi:dTDP-3,4-didehydro-2,6-dideoxy-alpha-D-glucose 3-reductase